MIKLKVYECLEVGNYKEVGKVIEDGQRNGCRLRFYQAAGMGSGPMSFKINHCLLFEKGE